jgi:hypothetical protein
VRPKLAVIMVSGCHLVPVIYVSARGGGSYTGERPGDVVTHMAGLFPDVHRELLRVNDAGHVVAVELLIQGTFLGPLPTPAGPVAPTGAKVGIPTADFFYLRDGKIVMFNCYFSVNIMHAQMGINPDFASAVKPSAAIGLIDGGSGGLHRTWGGTHDSCQLGTRRDAQFREDPVQVVADGAVR